MSKGTDIGRTAGDRSLSDEELLSTGQEVLRVERDAIDGLSKRVGEGFVKAVRAILESPGSIVVCGVGKSGLVARKIAATFASTGTRAFFLHPADAGHGDVGMVGRGDVVLAISKSGEGEELLQLLPLVRDIGVTIVAITGDVGSTLASRSDIVVDVRVEREACPMDLVPTASTTAALALGDALAVAVLTEKEIDRDAFVSFHPAGALGRRLLLRVRDVMHSGDALPVVSADALMKDAIVEIAGKRLGLTMVVDGDQRLVGIVADGDLKRIIMKRTDVLNARVGDVMTPAPRTVGEDELVADALEKMETNEPGPITSLVIVTDEGKPRGVIHIHDCLRAMG
ncbi:MAG: KpsF/GutQ family sugar-phosphate isomerase [Candidatus Eisenbacteria bacterium]